MGSITTYFILTHTASQMPIQVRRAAAIPMDYLVVWNTLDIEKGDHLKVIRVA